MMNKIISREEIKRIVDQKKRKGIKIAFTNGCFDLIHVGHIRYLAKAREKGDVLIVGLNSDSSVRELKGDKRPLVPEGERAEVLSYLEIVDYVVIFEEITAEKLISIIKPDIYIKGGDYQVENLPESEVVKEYGGKIDLIPFIEGASTSNIIKEVLKRYR